MAKPNPYIGVLAGTNGAGKSSVAGAFLRAAGAEYFNPDEATRRILAVELGISEAEANSLAWKEGLRRLQSAIQEREDYWFETTLGGNTISETLVAAASSGVEVHIWYVGLSSPELHIARVAARVKRGGHDIPTDKIRERYSNSRRNLINLLPHLTELQVFDNSREADPATGQQPEPTLILRMQHGKILNPGDLPQAPEWAKPIISAALKLKPKT
ncbi:MAG: AAA family ATPase [Gammaproteobacteria bacterium]|nr:AAA family ATPase [Gammaproteobacteria bacterium]